MVDKLKYFAVEAYKKYTTSLVRYKPPENESNIIAKDIFDFIDNFHKKYGIKFDINSLIDKFNNENSQIYDITKNFIDLVFTDGDSYFSKVKDDDENNNLDDTKENLEIDNFEKEENNLIDKLDKLNFLENENEEEIDEKFEEKETLIEFEKLNYVEKQNGKIKQISKLHNNIIDKLYLFKKK